MTLLKTVVACLILANVCYFQWQRGIAKSSASAAPVIANSLRLASEGVAAHSPGDASSAVTAGAQPPGVSAGNAVAHEENHAALLTNVKRCISIGPFRDMAETAHAASTLRSGGYDPRQRVAEGEVWAGVWVFLPLPAARDAADKMLAKLKAGGIDDALEMPGPNDGPVVSLGLFSESKRAQARLSLAQNLGFNPGIADRKRNGNVYWIDVDLKPTDNLLNPSDLQSEGGRIVRLEVMGCPSGSPAS